jgi:hypothetical protein
MDDMKALFAFKPLLPLPLFPLIALTLNPLYSI